jgi:myo-inositol-1(or 4)-monophosphatase
MTAHSESRQLMEVAEAAALGVAPMLMAAFRSAMEIRTKRDAHDIVTEHDRASEAAIAAAIRAAVPGSVIVGEEGGRRGEGRVTWYVDPIDGTTNFARGLPTWCVSIAAEVEGRVVAGVVHAPVTGETFRADLSGAWLGDAALAAPARPREAEAVLLTSFPVARHYAALGEAAFAPHRALAEAFLSLRDPGTGALQLAWVAAGWADATLGFMTNPWDIAAGALILERAGGRFVALSGGETADAAQHADDYYGVGAGARYPTLDRVARQVSSRMPVRAALEAAGA